MNMYETNMDSYVVETIEYGLNLSKPPITPPNVILMHIPKIMSLIPKGDPKTFSQSVPNIYANDSKCKISTCGSTTIQNYLTIDKHRNQNPSFPKKDDGTGHIIQYSKFYLEVMHNDIRMIFYSDRI